MKKRFISAGAICLATTTLHAGGIDRSGQGVNILFEVGTVIQTSLSYTSPEVTGSLGGVSSGSAGQSFQIAAAAFKTSVNDKLDFALIYDHPFGAHVEYDSSYPLSVDPVNPGTQNSLRAESNSEALTGIMRYKFDNNFSANLGLRAQRIDADISVPAVAGYRVNTNSPVDYGYLIGVSWEKPEIAARFSLNYNSSIDHTFKQVETNSLGLNTTSTSNVSTPQSVNLDFQTGIAPKTLLFGTIRWVDWSQLSYVPPNYSLGEIVGFGNSVTTYSLGVGRKITEKFSGALSVGYEESQDIPVTNLAPTDGKLILGVAGTYDFGKAKVSAGVRYTDLGDTTTTSGAEFSGNDAWTSGVQVTYTLK
jgi:long-subunit fatty acid transport protein